MLILKTSFSIYRKIVLLLIIPVILFFLLNFLFPLPDFIIKKDYSKVYLDRSGRLLRITLSPSGKYRIKLPYGEISPFVKKGIVAYEDKYFFYHPGVNPVAVIRAMIQNKSAGRIVSGASTITMQVARMIERKERTYLSKVIELFRALQLEITYSKKEILSLYLNMIPMGGNIEGIGAGAYFYFGKDAKNLSFAETLMLITIPKSPNRLRPDRSAERLHEQALKVVAKISDYMDIDKQTIDRIKNNVRSVKKLQNPFLCPHLVEASKGDKEKFYKQLTIDLNIQTFCENIFKNIDQENHQKNIHNGAVIVVDNKNLDVLAYVGSPDFYDNKNNGQINGANIYRSPGSTLKPFLYGRAIDMGLITPEKVVYDIPFESDGYNPANYSKKTSGIVKIREALTRSLNIPAVRLENQMGEGGLKYLLKKIYPYKRDVQIDRAGLSLVLGGFQMTLEELAALYAMLSRGGNYSKLNFFVNEKYNIAPIKVLSPESCFIVSEMLSEAFRPDLPFNWEFSPNHGKIALKTGTSFGLRDAWCVAYNPDYTVALWQGNVDSSGSSYLIGVQKAAPIAVKILNHLSRDNDRWYKKPAGVSTRKVCAVSGEKYGKYCKKFKTDYYIPGISSERDCTVHKQILINKKSGYEVCLDCMSPEVGEYEYRIVEYWPNEVVTYLIETGRRLDLIPPHKPDCLYFFNRNKPVIVSPKNLSEYRITGNVAENLQKIPLKANVSQDVKELTWLVGKKIISRTKPGETVFIKPQRGIMVISVIDSRGRSDSVSIKVY